MNQLGVQRSTLMSCIARDYVAPKQEQFNVCPKMFDTYHGGITYLTQTGVSQEILHEKPGIFQKKSFNRFREKPCFFTGK